jgi:hypothetical protein
MTGETHTNGDSPSAVTESTCFHREPYFVQPRLTVCDLATHE